MAREFGLEPKPNSFGDCNADQLHPALMFFSMAITTKNYTFRDFLFYSLQRVTSVGSKT